MGAKIPDLTQLSKEAESFLMVVHEEPDFASILIGASYLDQILASMLDRFFVKCKTAKKMLDPVKGSLGAYQSRADLVYCLGLIPKSLYQNLCLVGQVRNRLAHSYLALTSESPAISEIIDQLSFPFFSEVISAEGRKRNVDYFSTQVKHPRNKFNVIVALMIMELFSVARSIEHRSAKEKGWA